MLALTVTDCSGGGRARLSKLTAHKLKLLEAVCELTCIPGSWHAADVMQKALCYQIELVCPQWIKDAHLTSNKAAAKRLVKHLHWYTALRFGVESIEWNFGIHWTRRKIRNTERKIFDYKWCWMNSQERICWEITIQETLRKKDFNLVLKGWCWNTAMILQFLLTIPLYDLWHHISYWLFFQMHHNHG